MILKLLPVRVRVLPLVVITLVLLYAYVHLLDGDSFLPSPLNRQNLHPGTVVIVQQGTQPPSQAAPNENSKSGSELPNSISSPSRLESDPNNGLHSPGSTSAGSNSPGANSPLSSPSSQWDSHDKSHSNPESSSTHSGVEKGSVVMVTASTGTTGFQGIPGLKDMVYENRKSYAMRHGYDLMWANFTTYNLSGDAPVYFNKIPILQEAFVRFPQAEWLWWMDLDIIIMNSSLSLWDHLLSPEGMARNVVLDEVLRKPGGKNTSYRTPTSYEHDQVNFIISSGGWGMNVGNFLIRRSEWADWLLDLWTEPLYFHQEGWAHFPENEAWTHMYRHHPIVRNHTICTNQRSLNAYASYNTLGEHWEEGDHTIHFAGCGADPACSGVWEDYWSIREPYHVPDLVLQQLAAGTAEIEAFQKGEGLP